MPDVPLFPVVNAEIGVLIAHEALFIRFGFLTHESQKHEECDPGRRYVLSADQAQDLCNEIQKALGLLANAGPQTEPGTRQ